MTTIYYTVCKRLSEIAYKKAVSLLPKQMQQKLNKYLRWEDAHSYLYGKLLLKEAMLQLGCDYSLEDMKKTALGKPYFENSSFTFNISHSGEYIVCVVSTEEQMHLGIDIEKIRPIEVNDFNSIFSPQEKKHIDSYDKFYDCWTRKEAIVKADGRGMHIPLDTIDTTKSIINLDEHQYHMLKIDIDKEYILHMASLIKIENTKIVKFGAKNNSLLVL